MPLRLAIIGAALLIAGALDLGGYGTISAAAGGAALVAAGIAWLVARRQSASAARR